MKAPVTRPPAGPTGGFARDYRDYYVDLAHPKQLWVRALHPQALAWLSAAVLPPDLATQVPAPAPRCEYKSAQCGALWQHFHDQLTDPRARRGRRLQLSPILTRLPQLEGQIEFFQGVDRRNLLL